MSAETCLALWLYAGRASCFEQLPEGWRLKALKGEQSLSVASDEDVPNLLRELSEIRNRINKLEGCEIWLVAEDVMLPRLSRAPETLAKLQCAVWQILRAEPLLARARWAGAVPPDASWLQDVLLPLLAGVLRYEDEAWAAERRRAEDEHRKKLVRAEKEHEETMESLRAERAQLEAENARLRISLASLAKPRLETLLRFLPAIYRSVWNVIGPGDLALLSGGLTPPDIPSPAQEPSPDTVLMLKREVRTLPEEERRRLRDFCLALPHKLETRPELRAFLEEEA
jgi:hypothetical protein